MAVGVCCLSCLCKGGRRIWSHEIVIEGGCWSPELVVKVGYVKVVVGICHRSVVTVVVDGGQWIISLVKQAMRRSRLTLSWILSILKRIAVLPNLINVYHGKNEGLVFEVYFKGNVLTSYKNLKKNKANLVKAYLSDKNSFAKKVLNVLF